MKDPDEMIGISARIPRGAQEALYGICMEHGATKMIKGEVKPCVTTLLRMMASGGIQTIKCFEPVKLQLTYPYSRGKLKK